LTRRGGAIFTRLEKLNLTKAQREDAINYLPGHVVEFHRRAAGGFKSGEQWQVIGSQGRKEIVIERNGERRFLPLAHAGKFTLFRAESFALSVGDTVRITKNFRADGTRFRNKELHTVTAIETGKVTLDAGELGDRGALHLDQGIVVTRDDIARIFYAGFGFDVLGRARNYAPARSFEACRNRRSRTSGSRGTSAMVIWRDSTTAPHLTDS